jgi:hypothetical protein
MPSPTVSPNYENIPLPPSDTCMVASTRVASPYYMPHTLSPVNYWMPKDKDIQGDMGTATEHATFVVAHRFTFRLSWSRAILLHSKLDARWPNLGM